MRDCDFCQKTIIFGGRRAGQFIFCSNSCEIMGQSLIEGYNLPDHVVDSELGRVHQSNCPLCNGRGPIDVHYYSSIWSIIYFTSWKANYKIGCRKCGIKSQVFASIFSFLFGWWGFPWGLVITPIQIGKNIKAIIFPFSTLKPSRDFEKIIRLSIVQRLREEKGLSPKIG